MNRALCIVSLALLSACAGQPEAGPAPAPAGESVQQVAAAASAADGPVVCHRVTPVGSNLAVTRCEKAQTASDHMDTRDMVRALAGPGAPGAGIGGH